MPIEHTPIQLMLFFVLYGASGTAGLLAALYLLLRRGNAFAPAVQPPLRLRRWTAALFAVAALGHVWWFAFFVLSGQPQSASEAMPSAWYAALSVLDCVAMLTALAGTLLAMLQDRRRPIWPVVATLTPLVVLGIVLMAWPSRSLTYVYFAYLLVAYVAFTIYMAVAVRQYGRWLRDNYADLEHKEVRLSHVVAFASMLMIVFYALIDSNLVLYFVLHLIELALFALLLWRVETLPRLTDNGAGLGIDPVPAPDADPEDDTPAHKFTLGSEAIGDIERLLKKRCVDTRLYLQHELTLVQLAKALDVNRTYLGLYFVEKGTTYNAYINNLRINHFMALRRQAVATGRSVTAKQLAQESGYRSYTTFSIAFKQRMGLSVTAWMDGEEMGQ